MVRSDKDRGNGVAPKKSCFRAFLGDTRRPKGDGSFFHATIGGLKQAASDDESDDYYHHSSNKQLEREGSYRTKPRQRKFPLCNLKGLKLDKSHNTTATVTSSNSQCILLTSKNTQNNENKSSKKSVSSTNGYRAPDIMWLQPEEAPPSVDIEVLEDVEEDEFPSDYHDESNTTLSYITTISSGASKYDLSATPTTYSQIRNTSKITEQIKPRRVKSSSASARSGQHSHGELTVEEEEEFLDSLATFLTTEEKKQRKYQYQDLERDIDQITGKTKEQRQQLRDGDVPSFIGLEIRAHKEDKTQTFVNDVDDTVSLGSSFQHLSTPHTRNTCYDLSQKDNSTPGRKNRNNSKKNSPNHSFPRQQHLQRPSAKFYRGGALLDSEISVCGNSSSAIGEDENSTVDFDSGSRSQRHYAAEKYEENSQRRRETAEKKKNYFQEAEDESSKSSRAKKLAQLERLRNGNRELDKENGLNGVPSKARRKTSDSRRIHQQDWKFPIDHPSPKTSNSTMETLRQTPVSRYEEAKYEGPSLLFPEEQDSFVELSSEEEPEIALTLPGLEKNAQKMSSMRIENRTSKSTNIRKNHHISDGRRTSIYAGNSSEQPPSRQPVRAVPLKPADSMKARPSSPLPHPEFPRGSTSGNSSSLARLKFTLA